MLVFLSLLESVDSLERDGIETFAAILIDSRLRSFQFTTWN